MSKFFDFCDKHTKALFCILFTTVCLCLVFPVMHSFTIERIIAPYFIVIFYDNRQVGSSLSAYAERQPQLPFSFYDLQNKVIGLCETLFLAVSIALIAINIVLFVKRHKPLILSMLSCLIVHSILAGLTAKQDPPLSTYSSYVFEPFSNAYVFFILFFLYIVYLLLRRYYAPVKARILASLAERQANRKPTKDERIAELERKVAELESKNKDEQ